MNVKFTNFSEQFLYVGEMHFFGMEPTYLRITAIAVVKLKKKVSCHIIVSFRFYGLTHIKIDNSVPVISPFI